MLDAVAEEFARWLFTPVTPLQLLGAWGLWIMARDCRDWWTERRARRSGEQSRAAR